MEARTGHQPPLRAHRHAGHLACQYASTFCNPKWLVDSVQASTWRELRTRWPNAPTTGWDHWMRLSSTSKGRECVAPRINRSRHANRWLLLPCCATGRQHAVMLCQVF